MGRREVRRMLMGERKRLWERPWVLGALIAAVLALGVGIGVGIGHWHGRDRAQPRPAEVAAEVPVDQATARPAEPRDDDLLPPPPPRPDPDVPDEAVEPAPAPLAPQAATVPLLLPQPPVRPTAVDTAPWIKYSVPAVKAAGHPVIAVIIDDLGVDRRRADKVVALRAPLTLAFMSYAEDLGVQTAHARARGHELMVHVPMQPQGEAYDPGPDVLEVGLTPQELRRRIDWALSRFEGFVAINNHMGSRFTADRDGMRVVMEEMRRRGLAFVDSVTTDKSVAPELAKRYGVPFAARHVFLDNEQDVAAVRAQLAKAEAHARKYGAAIAIGHPHDATIEALSTWLPGLEARGLVLVPVTAIIKLNEKG